MSRLALIAGLLIALTAQAVPSPRFKRFTQRQPPGRSTRGLLAKKASQTNPGLLDSLIAMWQFDGSLVDSTGAHNAGYVGSTPAYGAGLSSIGQAIHVNGTYIQVPNDSALRPSGAFTVAAWINTAALGGYQNIFQSYSQTSGILGIDFRISGGSLNAVLGGFGGWDQTFAGSISAGTWTHVMLTYNPPVAYLYVNNNVVGVFSRNNVAYASDNRVDIGISEGVGAGNFYSPFDGYLQQVAVWNKVLDSQQRSDLYNGGLGLSYANIAGQ